MKYETSRLNLITEFESAPINALFSQETIAAIRQCSIATVERDRWAGKGVKFIKIGRLVRYRKKDIQEWLEQYPALQSTTQVQQLKK
jgi:hypothetical protein